MHKLLLALSMAAAPVGAALAQAETDEHLAHHTAAAAPAAGDMADGEIRKIDREGGKVTLKHGEIRSLDMPPMTMVFQVRDALLDKLAAGDLVRFEAERTVSGALVVTVIQPAAPARGDRK